MKKLLKNNRDEKGYTLLEIILVIGVILAIITVSARFAIQSVKEANAKRVTSEIYNVIHNAEAIALLNSPDGSTKSSNPIDMDTLNKMKSLPSSLADFSDEDYYNPNLGQVSTNYSSEYPNSNVIELNIRNMSEETCRRIVITAPQQFLEVKMDGNYLPHKKTTLSDGSVGYKVDFANAAAMCKDFVGGSNAGIMKIRHFVAPDMNKIYTFGGDIAGTSDPKANERNQQIKKFTDAYNYTYALREAHIKTNLK